MGESLIIRRGSGRGLRASDAVLHVTAPVNSFITISKNGIIYSSSFGHQDADDITMNSYYFIINSSLFDSINSWTVTATLETKSVSKNVIINSSSNYNLILRFGYYLIENGKITNSINASAGGATEYDGFVTMTASNGEMAFTSQNPIDLTDYSTVVLNVVGNNSASAYNGSHPLLAIGKSRPNYGGGNVVASVLLNTSTGSIQPGRYSLDVSSFVGEYYIAVILKYIGTNNYGRVDTNLWGVE